MHDLREFGHRLDAAIEVIHAVVHKALGGGSVGVEGRDGHAVVDGMVDGVGELVGVGATHGEPLGAGEHELLDGLGLLLGVLLVGRAPVDLDVQAALGADFPGGVLGADAGGLKDGVALGFGDQSNGDGAGGGRGQGGADRKEQEQFFHKIQGRRRGYEVAWVSRRLASQVLKLSSTTAAMTTVPMMIWE